MRTCEGCGAPADETHIRQRIERLELATKFRPIHIQVLLIGDAPPARAEDYFYRVNEDPVARSEGARKLFDEMMLAAGIARDSFTTEDAALAEFQHRGFFLADVVECPLAAPEELLARISKLAPTLLKRIEFSYRPKQIVLVGSARNQLATLLKDAGVPARES